MENALHGVFHHSERGTGDGKGALDRIFHLSERGTNVKTEILAGVTTFVTAAYILAVNPSVLAATGMPQDALFTATVLISTIGTLMMALLTNYPFILCPGMGINAYFAYTVCLGMGYSWQTALGAIFVEGIIFVILSLTNVREAIFNAIPMNLKFAITSGVGLFITIIGLKGSGLVIPSESTLVTMFTLAATPLSFMAASAMDPDSLILISLLSTFRFASSSSFSSSSILSPCSTSISRRSLRLILLSSFFFIRRLLVF